MRISVTLHAGILLYASADECPDGALENECLEYCLSKRVDCIDDCGENKDCLYKCNDKFGDCFNHCPCQFECPTGCSDCESSFCLCRDDYHTCEDRVIVF